MSTRTIHCYGPKPEYLTDPDDPYVDRYIPVRMLAACGSKDVVVLPDDPLVGEFVEFLEYTIGLRPEQVVYASGDRLLQRSVSQQLARLKELASGGNWQIRGYAIDEDLCTLSEELGVPVVGDGPEWVERFGHKGVLHPKPGEQSRLAAGIRVARGYTCKTLAQLTRAFDLLREDGVSQMLLKPIYGSAGQGIERVGLSGFARPYTFPLGPVVLEEFLIVDKDSRGRLLSPSIQFSGEVGDQDFAGMAHTGNRVPSVASQEFVGQLRRACTYFKEWARPQGPGGLDAVSVSGLPVIVDVNGGRCTGAQPGIEFQRRYVPSVARYRSWKQVPPRGLSIAQFWRRLQKRGVALEPGGANSTGVFPLGYLPGEYGLFFAGAQSEEELDCLYVTVSELLR